VTNFTPLIKSIKSPSFKDSLETPMFQKSKSNINAYNSLNQHLRGQSFTPLPHKCEGEEGNNRNSPTFNPALSDFAPQLSWSLAGDSPPHSGGIDSWNDKDEVKYEKSSLSLEGTSISPMCWKKENISTRYQDQSECGDNDEDESNQDDNDFTFKFSIMSPNSINGDELIGKTTPLPLDFNRNPANNTEEQENMSNNNQDNLGHQTNRRNYDYRVDMEQSKRPKQDQIKSRKNTPPFSPSNSSSIKTMPTTSVGQNQGNTRIRESEFTQNRPLTSRNAHHMYQRNMFHPSAARSVNISIEYQRQRILNNHGKFHPELHHPSSNPFYFRQHMLHHRHNMRWGSQHHYLHHSQMTQRPNNASKRKCMPMKAPIPSKFQGDMDKVANAQVPDFSSLVNFPSHMSQKQSVNLPDGMRCCVMCGHGYPCSIANKSKKKNLNKSKDNFGNEMPSFGGNSRQANNQTTNQNGAYAIIPTQNKGLCTQCDVNVWVVASSGLEIKWCKGCKNFRPWAAFGEKGLATKCLKCRDRQREKYAALKEEKEKEKGKEKGEQMDMGQNELFPVEASSELGK